MNPLELAGVTRTHGTTTALDRVDLVVRPGTVHGLLGPNGAGKTTLLRLVLGLLRPDHGTVRVLGADPWGRTPDRLAGFADAPRFYPTLTGRQNLALLAAYDRRGASVDDALDRVGLGERAGEKVRGWSTGMRQRLALAAALVRAPELLVLDEPASGLDPAGAEGLHDLVRSAAADGTTVLLSSHDMAEVDRLCSRVTVLDRGRVVLDSELASARAMAPAARWRVRTSDDAAAAATPGVTVLPGMLVEATQPELDAWVLALGRAGVAVRELTTERSPLAGLYFTLTGAA